jgi:hypothetical protein
MICGLDQPAINRRSTKQHPINRVSWIYPARWCSPKIYGSTAPHVSSALSPLTAEMAQDAAAMVVEWMKGWTLIGAGERGFVSIQLAKTFVCVNQRPVMGSGPHSTVEATG